jgi:Na+/H+ antiporter NhaD/arsenite permease-like protein
VRDRIPIESVWIGCFGLWLGVLATVLWLWNGDPLAPILLTGAAVAMVLLALYAVALRVRPIETRLLGDASLPTVVLVFGIAMMVNGAEFGLWLVLIGAEVAVLGLGGLVRELVVSRRGTGRGRARR